MHITVCLKLFFTQLIEITESLIAAMIGRQLTYSASSLVGLELAGCSSSFTFCVLPITCICHSVKGHIPVLE